MKDLCLGMTVIILLFAFGANAEPIFPYKYNVEMLENINAPSPPSRSFGTTPKPKEVLEDDKQIVNFPLNIKPENVKIVKVENLFL